jgi:asparagine N-glycosylation enzyme membrane subunit Stt3
MTMPAREAANGGAAAAIVAAGVGCFAVGVLALAGDGVKAVAKLLTFYRPTGPLSGVSTMAIAAWLVTWFVLARRWGGRSVSMTKVSAVAFVSLALGLLLTFLLFEDLLLGK